MRERTSVALISLASLCLSLSSCDGRTTPASPIATKSTMMTWAPPFATGGRAPTEDAVARARGFQVIGAHPWTYRSDVVQMRRARPDLVLLAYMNGTFAQKAQAHAFPPSWYLRDVNGAKVRSFGWGNYLMDPTNPGWITDRVERCRRFLMVSGYDGCLVDLLGTAPINDWYVTGAPIDPRTGQRWTATSWLAATAALATAIREGSPGATVIGNGLGDGRRFFDANAPSEQILAGIDGGIADGWLRTSGQAIDRYPSLQGWKRDVDMLRATDKSVFVETKVWTTATQQQRAAWYRFALASFLLGNDGNAYFAFSGSQTRSISAPDPRAGAIRLGYPIGGYREVGGLYERSFSNGIVVVDPTDEPLPTDLGAEYRDEDGRLVRSITLAPHSAMILTTP
jgi:hypothetical protein